MNRKKIIRILIVGRGTIHTLNWVDGLRAVAKNRLELHVATDGFIGERSGIKWYSLPHLKKFPIWGIRGILNRTLVPFWAFFKIHSLIKNIRPEIVHLQSLFYPSWIAGLYVHNIPLVVTPWDGEILWRKFGISPPKILVLYLLRKANLITCVSQYFADYCKLLLAPNRNNHVVQVHWGFDQQRFYPTRSRLELRNKLGLSTELIVLSSRQLEKKYNIPTVLRAVAIAAQKTKRPFQVVFIYPYEHNQLIEMKKLSKELGIESLVKWVGEIDHSLVHKYYQAADIFISMCQKDTGPISMVEAMASGAFCIMNDSPSVRECIVNGKTGILVQAYDFERCGMALAKAINEDSYREDISRKSALAIYKYRRQNMVNKLVNHYWQLIAERKPCIDD